MLNTICPEVAEVQLTHVLEARKGWPEKFCIWCRKSEAELDAELQAERATPGMEESHG